MRRKIEVCEICKRKFKNRKSFTNHYRWCSDSPKYDNYKKKFKKDVSKRQQNKNNSCWKGKDVCYATLHKWIRRNKKKPKLCEVCKKEIPTDVANISGKYKRLLSDYKWVCKKCHAKMDDLSTKISKTLRRRDKNGMGANSKTRFTTKYKRNRKYRG